MIRVSTVVRLYDVDLRSRIKSNSVEWSTARMKFPHSPGPFVQASVILLICFHQLILVNRLESSRFLAYSLDIVSNNAE